MPTVLIVDDNAELANLLAVVADANGIETRLAYSGREALASLEECSPHAALVDLLLPDMRGHDVLQQLTARGIPCFAMSGVFRGDGLIREATEVYGAKGFFEKPFVARELMARLSELLGRGDASEAAGAPRVLEELRLDDEAPAEREEPVPSLDELDVPAQTTGIFAIDQSARPAAAPLDVLPSQPPADDAPGSAPETVGAWIAHAPSVAVGLEERSAGVLASEAAPVTAGGHFPADAQREPNAVVASEPSEPASPSVVGVGPQPSPPHAATEVTAAPDVVLPFSGREVWRPLSRPAPDAGQAPTRLDDAKGVSRSSIPRLLTALFLGQQTGELRIRRAELVKIIGIHEGRPVSAASNLGSERFARFAVRVGALPAAKLAFVQEEARRAGMRTSEAMVALGLMTEPDRRQLLERQVKHIIWSTFDWEECETQFVPRESPRADLTKISLAPGPLILEGIRASFSLVRLRELVRPNLRYSPTADPPYQLQDLALGDREALLLAHADGSKTVEDLVVLSDLSEREALALLHGLAQTEILEPREVVPRRSRVVLV
jgi:CheY-like chemotaxis protein